MHAYICGRSALEYYRANRVPADTPDNKPEHLRLEDAARTVRDLSYVERAGLRLPDPTPETPLNLLAPSAERRSTVASVHTTVWRKELPAGSLVKGNEYASIASPELLFVQMARELSLPELVELGMELCGTYRLACAQYDTRFDLAPLTTVLKLKQFIGRADGIPGVAQAQAALKHIAPNSASPMETVLYLLLCLPRRLGGYAFPQPTLNGEVKIKAAGKRYTLRKSSRPDLCWKSKKFDLEYQGQTHEEVESRAEDSMRRKALEKMGYTVFELTYKELADADLFRANVRSIANALGLRIRSRGEGDFAEREERLRNTLLGSRTNKLKEWEDAYWQEQSAQPTKSLREIAESYGITELPPEYASWEDYLKGYVPFEVEPEF